MAVDVKETKKQKSILALTFAKIRAHLLGAILPLAREGEGGERAEAAERRYIFLSVRAILGSVFSILLSRTQLAFSIYPFGAAFLCASGRFTPLYAAAALVCSLTLDGVSALYAASIALLLLLRTFVCLYNDMTEDGVRRFPVYSEHFAYRVTVACISAFGIGLYTLFYGGFTYYSFIGSLAAMAVIPISSYIFVYALDPTAGEEHRDVARLFLCAVLVWSLSDVRLMSVGMADMMIFCLVMSEAAKGRLASAALMGLAAGLPFGVSSAVIYALAGIAGTLLCSLTPFLGCSGTFTFVVMAQGYIGGYTALVSCLPGATVGLVVTLLIQRYGLRERLGAFFLGAAPEPAEEHVSTAEDAAQRISDISDTFSSLSSMLSSLSAYGEHSRILDTRRIIEQCTDEVCSDCAERGRCYGENAAETADAIRMTAAALSRERRLRESGLGRFFREECMRREELVDTANRRMSEAEEQAMRRGGCRLLASDYEAMSRILDSHLRRARQTGALDRETSDALTELCRRRMYGISSVSVWGKRRKKIYACGIDLASHTVSALELRREFGRICRCTLSSPVYSVDGARLELEMHSLPQLKAVGASASIPKEGERECGDCVRTFENSDGYAYGVLCDGMGSGEEAAYTGGICVEYISSMLEHANPKELTVEMLNAVLREQTGECSSTVDLFELDTYTGQGCFIKSGAAPSYVCRGRDVYRVSARTIPIGITERIGAERIRFRLRAGDIVVMVSDGVVESAEESRMIVDALCRRAGDDPRQLAASLLREARERLGGRDDMTVAVMCISQAEDEENTELMLK